jgi:MarR family transcriptional regulator, temperature-dependent positive regulator of motility
MDSATVPGSMVLLTRLSRAVYRRSNEEVLGMRLKGYVALCYLRDRGAATQQQLGEKMMVDPNNLVLLLNELEDAGYLTRRRDPDDRRRHIVELTDAGRGAIERAEQGMESVEEEILAALSAKERATLRELLNKALEGAPADTV